MANNNDIVQRLQEEREAEEADWNYALKFAKLIFLKTHERRPIMLSDYIRIMNSDYGVEPNLAKHIMSHYQSSGLVKYRLAYGIYQLTGKHPEPDINWKKDENGKVL